MNNVTAIIVSYNTMGLLQNAYESLRRYYPQMPVVIVDNSDLANPCRRYARKIAYGPTRCVTNNANFGHGPGMILGISCVNTPYFLLMDSDVTINCSGIIERMLDDIGDAYGAGKVVMVDKDGMNGSDIPYLHPHFALINKSRYLECDPIINHGAPMFKAMKCKPKLVGLEWGDNVTHHERGTRKLNPRGFHPRFWDKG